MNTVAEVMAELKKKGSPLRVRAFAPHGAPKGSKEVDPKNLFPKSLSA